jgi:phage gp37-like protein
MDFESIEDSIITELKAQVPYLKTVETYAGQLEQDIEALPVRFPAAYVAYGGSSFAQGDLGSASHRETAAFTVFVCAGDLRGAEAARKGEQGAYEAVRDVLGALINNDFDLETDMLRPVRVSLLFAGGQTAVYAVELMTEFEHA